jgi:hypothetical protein
MFCFHGHGFICRVAQFLSGVVPLGFHRNLLHVMEMQEDSGRKSNISRGVDRGHAFKRIYYVRLHDEITDVLCCERLILKSFTALSLQTVFMAKNFSLMTFYFHLIGRIQYSGKFALKQYFSSTDIRSSPSQSEDRFVACSYAYCYTNWRPVFCQNTRAEGRLLASAVTSLVNNLIYCNEFTRFFFTMGVYYTQDSRLQSATPVEL